MLAFVLVVLGIFAFRRLREHIGFSKLKSISSEHGSEISGHSLPHGEVIEDEGDIEIILNKAPNSSFANRNSSSYLSITTWKFKHATEELY